MIIWHIFLLIGGCIWIFGAIVGGDMVTFNPIVDMIIGAVVIILAILGLITED